MPVLRHETQSITLLTIIIYRTYGDIGVISLHDIYASCLFRHGVWQALRNVCYFDITFLQPGSFILNLNRHYLLPQNRTLAPEISQMEPY